MQMRKITNREELYFNKKKKNVCAYARISSYKDISHSSFDNQIDTYGKQIMNNVEWSFIGVFADESKSGTNTKQRPQFNQMLSMAYNGLIDLIITKSISRFSRNTIDTLSILHKLKECNVEVFFEKENISSFDPKIEFVISILSGIAEEEAKSVSDNVKWSIRNNFKNGESYFVTHGFLGYTRDKEKNLIINETEAETVRLIFNMYASGEKVTKIISSLHSINAKTVSGNSEWYSNAVLNIIKNERYCGDAMLQKTYRPSFKSKLNKVNNNVLPIYYVENNHPPIVSRELFQKANQIRLKKIDKYLNYEKSTYSKKTIYASLIYCPYCGSNYIHRVNSHGTSYSKYMMHCKTNKGKKLCEGDNISLEIFDAQLLNMINQILNNKTKFLKLFKIHLETDKQRNDFYNKQIQLEKKIETLHSKLEILSFDDVLDVKVRNTIKLKISKLQGELNNINNILLTQYNIEYQYLRMRKLLTAQSQQLACISDFPFRNLFSKVIVESKDCIKFLIGNRTDFQNFNHRKKAIYNQSTSYILREKSLQSKSELHFF